MPAIDKFSYKLGAADCFCEMVRAGVKKIALAHPCDAREERDSFLAEYEKLCQEYGVKMYQEDEGFLTDLFPVSMNRDKHNILLYRAGHVLEQYLRLKARKRTLVEEKAYFGGNRSQIAWEFGRLLSYPEEIIHRLMSENPEKERL